MKAELINWFCSCRLEFLQTTSPKQPPQTTLPTLQAPGGTKTIHSFCSYLRQHICCLNTQSGSRSLLKRLSESREEAAVLEPFLRTCLLPLAAQGAQGSLNGSQAILGSQEAVLELFSLTIYSALLLFILHLTIRVNPQQVNPLKSLHIDETMVGLSLALLPRARPKSKSTALLKLSGFSQPINFTSPKT